MTDSLKTYRYTGNARRADWLSIADGLFTANNNKEPQEMTYAEACLAREHLRDMSLRAYCCRVEQPDAYANAGRCLDAIEQDCSAALGRELKEAERRYKK